MPAPTTGGPDPDRRPGATAVRGPAACIAGLLQGLLSALPVHRRHSKRQHRQDRGHLTDAGEVMLGDEARMKAELFSLDVRVDNLLEPMSALGGIHTTRRGRAAEQSKSHREVSCSRCAGAAVLAAGGLLKRPPILGMSIAVRAQTVAPTSCKHGERERFCASSTPFAGITQTGSTGLISAHVIRAPRS
jgi:hypothetical protein